MSNTANFNADIYQQDEVVEDPVDIDNYDPDIDQDNQREEEDIALDQRELDRKFNDLLFCV